MNVSLFPVLFFFSALYYTDVGATICVLVCYLQYLKRGDPSSGNLPQSPLVKDLALVQSGLVALLSRQTNVFWVTAFLGGLEVVRTLKSKQRSVDVMRSSTFYDVCVRSWSNSEIYDPPAGEAYVEGRSNCPPWVQIGSI